MPYPFADKLPDDDDHSRRRWWRIEIPIKALGGTTATYIYRGEIKAKEIAKKLYAVSMTEVAEKDVPKLCRYDTSHQGASNGRKREK